MGLLDGRVAFITGVARGQGRSHVVRLAAAGVETVTRGVGRRHRRQPGRRVQHARRDRAGDPGGGKRGSIIVTSSGAGLKTFYNLASYNASKFGVIGLARTLANELATERIRVNVIAPGTVGTPMVTAGEAQFPLFRPDLENPALEDCKPAFASMMPMGEPWVDPEDISNVLVFLASDKARYITGTRHPGRPRQQQQAIARPAAIDPLWDVPSPQCAASRSKRRTTSPIVNFCTISERGQSSRTGHLPIGCDHFFHLPITSDHFRVQFALFIPTQVIER